MPPRSPADIPWFERKELATCCLERSHVDPNDGLRFIEQYVYERLMKCKLWRSNELDDMGRSKWCPERLNQCNVPKSSCQLGRKWIGHVIKYGHSIPTALLLQIPFPLTALYPSRRAPTYVLCRISCFQKKSTLWDDPAKNKPMPVMSFEKNLLLLFHSFYILYNIF